jgi:hypothetical protein
MVLAIVVVLLLSSVLYRYEGGLPKQSQTPPNLALQSATFYRPVEARMYSFNTCASTGLNPGTGTDGCWAIGSDTPAQVGNAIAALTPSFVSGLIRLEANASVTPAMIASYNTVRGIVLAANPNAKFDIWFRADKIGCTKVAAMVAAMQGVLTSGIRVDAFSFDDLSCVSASGLQQLVAFAHGNGEMIGGDCATTCPGLDYIAGANTPVPCLTACASANSFNAASTFSGLWINQTAMAAQSKLGIPILLALPNGPTPVDSASNTFHSDWVNLFTDSQREGILSSLAAQQKGDCYALEYPVFWPAGTVGPPSVYWNSPGDGSMLQFMAGLATTYNVHP